MNEQWVRRTIRVLKRLTVRCHACGTKISYTGGSYDDGSTSLRGWCTSCGTHPIEINEHDVRVPHKEIKLKGGPSGRTG
jgi:hypothetical protein